jgi:hypothetical protein
VFCNYCFVEEEIFAGLWMVVGPLLEEQTPHKSSADYQYTHSVHVRIKTEEKDIIIDFTNRVLVSIKFSIHVISSLRQHNTTHPSKRQ